MSFKICLMEYNCKNDHLISLGCIFAFMDTHGISDLTHTRDAHAQPWLAGEVRRRAAFDLLISHTRLHHMLAN